MRIREVRRGAYFVPGQFEHTVMSFHPSLTNQTIVTACQGEPDEATSKEEDRSEEDKLPDR